ncbi:MAG TPA: preprotein translocase subunit SecE [Jiangellales bacterium]|nr:preprotein translocase subunit SecE [Jiangellales bacterium]
MADSNRRDEDAADERLDDDELLDETGDDEPVGRGGTTTRSRARAESAEGRPKARREAERAGVFSRIGRFIREVVAELRKVIWPTRNELLTYTVVVVVFLAVMLAILSSLDFAFAKAVLFVFGNPS